MRVQKQKKVANSVGIGPVFLLRADVMLPTGFNIFRVDSSISKIYFLFWIKWITLVEVLYSQFTSAGLAEIYDLKQMGALGDPKHVPINYRHFCGEILSILRFRIFEYNAHTDNIRV